MHDPKTVAHEIRYPWRANPKSPHAWMRTYRAAFVTIWHVDPEKDGTDDSCGWFIRGRHLSQADKDLAHRLIHDPDDNIKYWFTGSDDEEKMWHLLGCFAALRRRERRWWKHPRWHFWHWKIQVHPWQKFRRWLLSRCCKCGGRFAYGECPTSTGWGGSKRPGFLKGEVGIYHGRCADHPLQPSS